MALTALVIWIENNLLGWTKWMTNAAIMLQELRADESVSVGTWKQHHILAVAVSHADVFQWKPSVRHRATVLENGISIKETIQSSGKLEADVQNHLKAQPFCRNDEWLVKNIKTAE